jgi:lipoprotein-anchoring transpeptidase ErfK/SrfK
VRLSPTARVYSQCESRNCVIDVFLRHTFIARADFSRNRFTGTNGLPAAKWARRSSLAISSGRFGHLTERGSFKILEKERNHYSSLYGKIVDSRGNTVVADADADMAVPSGGKFIPAPMHYFMRFTGADGMHAGFLPGYPASHGCVRMPEQYAIAFFNAVSVGTPVTVHGRTPTGRFLGQSQRIFPSTPVRFRDPHFDPRFRPPRPPWWWR